MPTARVTALVFRQRAEGLFNHCLAVTNWKKQFTNKGTHWRNRKAWKFKAWLIYFFPSLSAKKHVFHFYILITFLNDVYDALHVKRFTLSSQSKPNQTRMETLCTHCCNHPTDYWLRALLKQSTGYGLKSVVQVHLEHVYLHFGCSTV